MINREEFNRALRLSIVIFIVAIFILAFLWINFLYSRFTMETEVYRSETEAEIEQQVADKVEVVVRQADLLYEEETRLLKEVMTNRMNVIKSNLFDYADLPSELLSYRLIEDARQFHGNTGISEIINSERYGFQIGGVVDRSVFQIREFDQRDDILYYSEYSAPARADIQLKVNQSEYLRAKINKWISDYRELEPNLILLDPTGRPLAGTVEVSDAFREEHYVSLASSELSGYTFGYYRPKAELQMLLNQRQAMFQRFLDNHMIEIAAFLVLLVVTLAIFIGRLARQHNQQLSSLNDEIIQRYREPESNAGELYREYGLSRAVDSLVADARKNQQYIQVMQRQHHKELKQANIELLQMERRYEYLLAKESEETFTRFAPLQQPIQLQPMILAAHREFDPEAELRLLGNDSQILSDPAILPMLIENFFRLSDHPTRHYRLEYLVEGGFVKLMLNLENAGQIDSAAVERIKFLASLLGGSILRLNHDWEKFSLELRLSSE